jgi:hypothetical protein
MLGGRLCLKVSPRELNSLWAFRDLQNKCYEICTLQSLYQRKHIQIVFVDVLIISGDAQQFSVLPIPLSDYEGQQLILTKEMNPFFIPVQFWHDAYHCFSYKTFDKPGKTLSNDM